MAIPRIIHQSWKTSDIPFGIYPRFWQQSWRDLHSGWTYRLWTDRDNRELVRRDYPRFLTFFDSLDLGIKRADFCRFLYLHRYGGLYVDLDFVALKDQSPLLEGAQLVVGTLSPENPSYRIPNAYMASEPGHEFWLRVAEDAMKTPSWKKEVEVLAGPLRLQWAIEKYFPGGLRILDQHLVYPLDWIHFTDWEGGRFYREDLVSIAQLLRTSDIAGIRGLLPNSFAVTAWTHNW